MKRVILSAALAIIFMASCKENETADPAPTPPVVEDPAPPAAPEPRATSTTTTTTTTTSEENPDGTSISIGRDGVDISTKDGDESKKVKLSTTTKEVQVKTTE